MSKSVKVSVTIPVFNSAATLQRCVRSVMQQTLTDIEIMIADDGSTDQSADIAQQFAQEDDRVRLLRLGKNGGKPQAMNLMVSQARGDWVAVLDADDAYHPDRLQLLVAQAEATGVEMAADNLWYIDAGVQRKLRTAFPSGDDVTILGKADLIRNANSLADFDYGILKPMVRRDFIERHGLRYQEQARLAEDFYYLLAFFVAGGRMCLLNRPMYDWTLPFGTVSRAWTTTGNGAWRYDYAQALVVNQMVLTDMQQRGEMDAAALLQRRARQYKVMIPYLKAQKLASEGHRIAAARTLLTHPETFGLLASRVTGRIARAWRPPTDPQADGVLS